MQERHARADVADDPPRLLLGERLVTVLQQGAEVPPGEQLHDENQPVRPRGDGPEHVDRVRAAEANHGIELAQKRLALALGELRVALTPHSGIKHVILAELTEVVVDVKDLRCCTGGTQSVLKSRIKRNVCRKGWLKIYARPFRDISLLLGQNIYIKHVNTSSCEYGASLKRQK